MLINLLALDVGSRRIGVAVSTDGIKIAQTLPHIDAGEGREFDSIIAVIEEYRIGRVVVGFPRNQSGATTDQTAAVEKFVAQLAQRTDIPIVYQDESLTSLAAEERLKMSKQPYSKGEVDSMAASLILQDYLESYDT